MPNDERIPATFEGILGLVERLRGPDGCPWDREQTRRSLRGEFIEECYELVEAVERGDTGLMLEELGDVLLHVAFHLQIGKETGEFQPEKVYAVLADKLVRRHPHVFGNEKVRDADEQAVRWEEIKREERSGRGVSALDGVPKLMPALHYAQAIQVRAARVGFDWSNLGGVLLKVAEELAELEEVGSPQDRERELGDLLFSIVNAGRWLGVDVEAALRGANTRFYRRFVRMEQLSGERGLVFARLSPDEKESLWAQAKAEES